MSDDQMELGGPGTEVSTTEESRAVTMPDMGHLMELAVEKGMEGAEVLEKLVGLQERIMDRNARSSFFRARHSFQQECPEIRKSGEAQIRTRSGATYGYTYAPLEEITRTVAPVLAKHGLSYHWTTEAGDRDFVVVVCTLTHVDGHEESARFPVPTHTDAAMSQAQKNGAAMTYGRRQTLEAVLGLTTADDVDGAAAAQPIGEDEYEALNTRIQKLDWDSDKYRKFLAWLGVEAMEDIDMSQYPRALNALDTYLKESTS